MMFDNYQFDLTEDNLQHYRANLVRLAAIQDELKTLVQARDRILRELNGLKATLEAHRQAGSAIRLRAMEMLHQLLEPAGNGTMARRPLTLEDEALIGELDASRQRLEQAVDRTERRLRMAQFEAASLAQMVEDLEDQVAEIAADLDLREDGFLHERN